MSTMGVDDSFDLEKLLIVIDVDWRQRRWQAMGRHSGFVGVEEADMKGIMDVFEREWKVDFVGLKSNSCENFERTEAFVIEFL